MGSVCHRYMCILLYEKLTGCNGVVGIYPHLEGVSICQGYMLQRYVVNGGYLPRVEVHFSICENYLV